MSSTRAPPPPGTKQIKFGPKNGEVKHVVVLMLENRSFDSILGWLYDGKDKTPDGQPFEGLKEGMTLPDKNGNEIPVGKGAAPTDPPLNPGEPFPNVVHQMYSTEWDPKNPVDLRKEPEMKGFLLDFEKELDEAIHLQNEAREVKAGNDPEELEKLKKENFRHNDARNLEDTDRAAYLHCFTPDQVPVLAGLAKEYACSDTYHCSVPTQTFPNRSFMASATSGGIVTNTGFEEDPSTILERIGAAPTLFNQFVEAGVSWNIFYHDLSFAAILHIDQLKDYVDPALGYCKQMTSFYKQAKEGTLPAYSFIEPRYFPSATKRHNNNYNDHHPEDIWRAAYQRQDLKPGVWQGEDLVLSIYEALVNGPNWENTLFIINYDEHGGTFDHVPPPRATPPHPGAPPMEPHRFGFHRYGIRVPCVIVSPWIRQGRVLRPPNADDPPFDHTSILKSARELLAPQLPCLTQRDRDAPSIHHVFTEEAARKDGIDVALRIRRDHDKLRPETGVDLTKADIKALGIGPDDFWAQALNLFAEFRSEAVPVQAQSVAKDPWGRVRRMIRTISCLRPRLTKKNEKRPKQYKSPYHALKAIHAHGLFLPEPPSDDEGDDDAGTVDAADNLDGYLSDDESDGSAVSYLTDDETFPAIRDRQNAAGGDDLVLPPHPGHARHGGHAQTPVHVRPPPAVHAPSATSRPHHRYPTPPHINYLGEAPMTERQAHGRAYNALHRAHHALVSGQVTFVPGAGVHPTVTSRSRNIHATNVRMPTAGHLYAPPRSTSRRRR